MLTPWKRLVPTLLLAGCRPPAANREGPRPDGGQGGEWPGNPNVRFGMPCPTKAGPAWPPSPWRWLLLAC